MTDQRTIDWVPASPESPNGHPGGRTYPYCRHCWKECPSCGLTHRRMKHPPMHFHHADGHCCR